MHPIITKGGILLLLLFRPRVNHSFASWASLTEWRLHYKLETYSSFWTRKQCRMAFDLFILSQISGSPTATVLPCLLHYSPQGKASEPLTMKVELYPTVTVACGLFWAKCSHRLAVAFPIFPYPWSFDGFVHPPIKISHRHIPCLSIFVIVWCLFLPFNYFYFWIWCITFCLWAQPNLPLHLVGRWGREWLSRFIVGLFN